MTGTFKANNPVNTFLLFIYGVVLKFYFFHLLPAPVIEKPDGILYRDLLLGLQIISSDNPFIYPALAYLLLFTQAVSLNKILNDQRLIQRPTYLPAMSYLLITSLFAEWNILSSALIVNTLLIWVWFKINGLHNSSSPKASLFNIGLLIGISALFYFPALSFALLVVFVFVLTRKLNLTEWAIAIMGIITPYYYLFAWLFLSDNLKFYKTPILKINYPATNHNYWQLGAIGLVAIAFLTGAYFVQANFRKQTAQIRKSWSLMLVYFFIALLIPFINNTHSFKYWVLTAMPLAAFSTCAFLYPKKKWFPLLLHWLMVGFVIAISYYYK